MASMLERETIINWNAAEKTANIWSCDPSWITKIKKLPGAHEHQNGWEADIPKGWVKIAKPSVRKPMTAEHREKALKALAKARANKKKG